MTKTPARFHMRTTYLQVFTSTGKPLTVKMSKALRDKMIEFATTATEQTATPGNP
jgi:hypothetical protein